jgi:hypothetical protein
MKVYIGRFPKDGNKERKVQIRIDKYDSWNADSTLAFIAAPLLKQLQETKHGAPFVDDEDVPAGMNLRKSEAPELNNEWDVDEHHFVRWDWVLSEIIWAMTEIAEGKPTQDSFYDWSDVDREESVPLQIDKLKVDHEGLNAYNARLQKACELFGKYYMCLWD